jgi:hypothetical protein
MKKVAWLLSICFFTFFTTLFLSCKKKIASKADLITYINDPENGLQKSQQIGKIKAVLTYKPWQLMADKLKPGDLKITTVNKIKDNLFFVLSLSANNKELLRQLPFNQYSEMVQVMAFRMGGFIDAVPDNDKSVEPLNCAFQQTYGMGLANNILIVFDKKKLIIANNLRIHIKEFGLNIGDLYFDIDVSDIKHTQNIVVN